MVLRPITMVSLSRHPGEKWSSSKGPALVRCRRAASPSIDRRSPRCVECLRQCEGDRSPAEASLAERPWIRIIAANSDAGRTTAMRILQDLDIDFGKAIGAEQPVAVTKEER